MMRPGPRLFAAIFAWFALAGSAFAAEVQEINISYVKAPFNLQVIVEKQRGMLEKEFVKDGIKVVWHEIVSGAQQAQAMAAGSLDVGSVMNTASVLMANAGGNPVLIAEGVGRPSKTFAIVAKKDGPVSIKDLKGKTVAGPKGTALHQLLVAALTKQGMNIDDVKFVNMDPGRAAAAVMAGQVDAGLLAASLIIKTTEAGGHVIATADGLMTPLLVVGVSGAFAKQHPALLARVLKVHDEAAAYIKAHPDEAIAMGAEEHKISMPVARQLFAWSGMDNKLTQADVKAMEADARFLLDNGMLKQPVDPKTLVLPQAFK